MIAAGDVTLSWLTKHHGYKNSKKLNQLLRLGKETLIKSTWKKTQKEDKAIYQELDEWTEGLEQHIEEWIMTKEEKIQGIAGMLERERDDFARGMRHRFDAVLLHGTNKLEIGEEIKREHKNRAPDLIILQTSRKKAYKINWERLLELQRGIFTSVQITRLQWNSTPVLMVLTDHYFNMKETGLTKWNLWFVVTTPEGEGDKRKGTIKELTEAEHLKIYFADETLLETEKTHSM